MTARGIKTLDDLLERCVPIPDTGCWLWTASCTPRGYGWTRAYQENRAHRLAWVLAYGPIQDGLWVLHRCDTPSCCWPGHLFLGTHADNVADCVTKGRHQHGASHSSRTRIECRPRGERNGLAVLTEAIILAARTERTELGTSYVELGRRYGVHPDTIRYAVRGRNWKHLIGRML